MASNRSRGSDLLRADDVVEDQVPLVVGVGRRRERDRPAFVLLEERLAWRCSVGRPLPLGSTTVCDALHAMESFCRTEVSIATDVQRRPPRSSRA